jgi:fermentation-respiration switch protein FrsA (DUF1100 family)
MLGGAAVVAALDMIRRRFRGHRLFAPASEPERGWEPADYGFQRDAVEEVRIPSTHGRTLHGWYCRAASPIASLLFCHGNRGNITTDAALVRHLVDAGLNVLAFDYRGFGLSPGTPSPRGLVADALSAAREHDAIRPPNLPSLVYGFSLGGAVAAQAARRHAFDGLILQSTFTNLRDLARILFPRAPMHMIAGTAFDTLAVVRALEHPLLVIHGTADQAIPSWMAQSLYDECSTSPKRIALIEDGAHRDLHERDDAVARAVRTFIADVVQMRSGTSEMMP